MPRAKKPKEAKEKIVSQAKFAELKGVSRKTVTVWKQHGLVAMTSDGKVNVEETEWRLADRPEKFRGGTTKGGAAETPAAAPPRSKLPVAAPEIDAGEEIAPPAAPKPGDPQWMTFIEAQRLKEQHLALLKKQEYEKNCGELVRIEDVVGQVEREYAVVRERLMGIPGKLADKLVGMSRAEVEDALSKEITEALNELHAPAAAAGGGDGAGGETGAGAPGSEAAAASQPDRMG